MIEANSETALLRGFRPNRYRAQEIFQGTDKAFYNGDVACKITDISFEGMSLRSRTEVAPGDLIDISILIGDQEIVNIQAKVAWSKPDTIGCDFGCEISGGALDLNAIKQSAQRHAIHERAAFDRNAQFALIPPEYVVLGAQLTHALYGLRDRLQALESAREFTGETLSSDKMRKTLDDARDGFQLLWHEMNEIVRPIPRNDPRFAAIKWHTENILRLPLADAPIVKRSFEKPLGYPGDYQVMLYNYENETPAATDTLFDQTIHHIVATTVGAGIRARMLLTLKNIYKDFESSDPTAAQPFEILNVGCGPAREIKLLLEEKTIDKPLKINLIEQDEEALQHATEATAFGKFRTNGNAEIVPYHASFADLLRTGRLTDHLGQQDIIYSLGLVDYFSMATAKRMARDFYDKLKPGGQLIFCNVNDAREGIYWPLEFLCDWTIQYRNEAQMLEMFADLPGADVRVELEENKQVWVVFARKPINSA